MEKYIKKYKLSYQTKKELWISSFIFFFSMAGIIFSMIGSLIGKWGINPSYLWIYFTIHSNFIVMGYYGMRSWASYKNDSNYKKLINVKIHGAVTSYITITAVIAIFLLGPLYLLKLVGIGPGATPPQTLVSDPYFIAQVIDNLFIHILTPLFVLVHFLKFDDDSESVILWNFKDMTTWFIFPMAYGTIIYTYGAITNIYPYTIISPNPISGYGFGYYSILFTLGVVVAYSGICYLLFIYKKNQIKQNKNEE